MITFYIAGYTDDGESLDLIVNAPTAQEAVEHWSEYFGAMDLLDAKFTVDEVDLTTKDEKVFADDVVARVFSLSSHPQGLGRGAIAWNHIPIIALVKLST